MVDRLREFEARQDALTAKLSAAPATVPDVHPNVADIYSRKVERLAAPAIRGLIERIVLTPAVAWGEMDAKPVGDLGTIIEWTRGGERRRQASARVPDLSILVVAGAGFEPAMFR